jgi:hypothetical protein
VRLEAERVPEVDYEVDGNQPRPLHSPVQRVDIKPVDCLADACEQSACKDGPLVEGVQARRLDQRVEGVQVRGWKATAISLIYTLNGIMQRT